MGTKNDRMKDLNTVANALIGLGADQMKAFLDAHKDDKGVARQMDPELLNSIVGAFSAGANVKVLARRSLCHLEAGIVEEFNDPTIIAACEGCGASENYLGVDEETMLGDVHLDFWFYDDAIPSNARIAEAIREIADKLDPPKTDERLN